jgi:hypothetical protein
MFPLSIFALFCWLSAHQKVLIASNATNTYIVPPKKVVQDYSHGSYHPSLVALGAKWIWTEGADSRSHGYTLTF